jgi:hypothetical protein
MSEYTNIIIGLLWYGLGFLSGFFLAVYNLAVHAGRKADQ